VKIFPAIDLLEGKAVRLKKGLRDQATVYSDTPWTMIETFAAAGARRVHVVDLEGAFSGARQHSAVVRRICERASIPVQLGGGIRDEESLQSALDDGARWVVLGTAAIKSPAFAEAACRKHPGCVVVAVDAKDGMVAVEGWVETSSISAAELGARAESWGAAGLLYTDVSRDGMHAGPNVAATRDLAGAVSIPVIASGGVSSLEDLRALREAGIPAAIVGRALYDKHFTLEEALEVSGDVD
jgi:phosphoribosylformimino-5-aminoimidazole carboxamide ribotide isomerase